MSTNQKGTALVGGALSDEVMASTDSIFHTDQFGNQKGLQQFYSPPQASALAKRVIGDGVATLDLTAGDGSLLSCFGKPYSYGVEIDADQVKNSEGGYHAITGDVQHVYTLLRRGCPDWDAIVLNPPFGLMWEDPAIMGGKRLNSAVLTLKYANEILAEDGQLVFIAGRDRFYRQIADLPEAAGFYAVIECEDMFEGTAVPAIMAFGIHPGNRSAGDEGYEKRLVPRDMLDLAGDWVIELRDKALGPYGHVARRSPYSYSIPETFKAIQTEYDRRTEKRVKKNREYDVLLVGGTGVQYLPSGYATAALVKAGEASTFYGLNGQSVNYFVQNESLWVRLKELEANGILTIEPRLRVMVDELVDEARKEVLPLYEIKLTQRLGWLTEVNSIRCKKEWKDGGFAAGEFYNVYARSRTVTDTEQRVEESKKNPGEYVTKTYTKQRKVLEVRIGNWRFDDGNKAEASAAIQSLIDHFDLPDPGTIATKHPAELEALEQRAFHILDNEFLPNSRAWEAKHPKATPYRHSDYQKKDISRLAFKGGGLLSWDMGLGKTLGAMLFCRMMEEAGAKRQWLFVVPGDLVAQWTREFERFMGVTPTVLRPYKRKIGKKTVSVTMQEQCHKLAKYLKGGGEGIYIVHYEALAISGTQMKRLPPVVVEEKEDHKKVKGTGRYGYFYYDDDEDHAGYMSAVEDEDGGRKYRDQVPVSGPYDSSAPEGKTIRHGYIQDRWEKVIKQITSRELCPECHADTRDGWNGVYCSAEKIDGSKCGYAHVEVKVKPAASFLSTAFRQGVIVLDEATYIGSRNGSASQRSLAVRGLMARHKLAMTGTPIKNFVGQAFWILWWCLGNGSKRFGYTYDGGHSKFEADFSVIEWLNNGSKKESRKVLPEVTNLAMLWKLLASSCIRRRKEDTGEELPPKFYTEIKTPLGMAQAEQLKVWLDDFPKLFEEKYPDAPVVKAGMHTVMAPMLGLNVKLDYALTMPEADPDHKWTGVDGITNWTPANLRVVELAMALAKQGRKVLIGSNLIATSKWIAERLQEKGVKAIHIVEADGTTANKDKRAQHVHAFQTDDAQVFCAGVKAIRLGHNLDAANAVILHGLDWDYETTTQFVDRVHRRTSTEPVDIYCVLPTLDGQETLTSRKWDILAQKGQAANLALDGQLIEKLEAEVDQATVIRELMERGFRVTDDAVDELDVADAFEKMPDFADFNATGMIPKRPELPAQQVTEEQAAEVVCAFLSYFADKPAVEEQPTAEVEAPHEAAAEVETETVEWDDELEAELLAAEGLVEPTKPTIEAVIQYDEPIGPEPEPVVDVQAAFAEAGAQAADALLEVVTDATSQSDSSPAAPEAVEDTVPDEAVLAQNDAEMPADMAAVMEQMAAMQAQLAELQAKNNELEKRLEAPEQLSLLA